MEPNQAQSAPIESSRNDAAHLIERAVLFVANMALGIGLLTYSLGFIPDILGR